MLYWKHRMSWEEWRNQNQTLEQDEALRLYQTQLTAWEEYESEIFNLAQQNQQQLADQAEQAMVNIKTIISGSRV